MRKNFTQKVVNSSLANVLGVGHWVKELAVSGMFAWCSGAPIARTLWCGTISMISSYE